MRGTGITFGAFLAFLAMLGEQINIVPQDILAPPKPFPVRLGSA